MPHVQTAYTGRLMEVIFGAITLEALTKVELNKSDGPDAEQIDTTAWSDTTYQNIVDPLGSKGKDKATLTATCWGSTASYGDTKAAAVPMNTESLLTFDTAKGTASANTWSLATMQLTGRRTEISYDGFATQTLTFEANALGTWDSP